MPEIISRKEAIERGLKRYFMGKPCLRGHIAERYTLRRDCVVCSRQRDPVAKAKSRAKWVSKNPNYHREYDRKWKIRNREKLLPKNRERMRLNGHKYREKKRARERLRTEKINDLIAAIRAEIPELLKELDL